VGLRLVDHRSRLVAPHGENSRAKPGMSMNTAPLNVYTQVLDHSLRGAADKVGSELITIDHKSDGTSAVTDQNA